MSGEKNKLKTLAEIVAELRMGDDGGKPAYRIGRRDRVEISMPSRDKIRSLVIEEVHISELADWIEAAAERETIGNAATMHKALKKVRKIAAINICECVGDYSDKAIIEIADSALSAPARQCDVGTAEEKYQRWVHFCEKRLHSCHKCECKSPVGCTFKFGDMPYIKEGGEA